MNRSVTKLSAGAAKAALAGNTPAVRVVDCEGDEWKMGPRGFGCYFSDGTSTTLSADAYEPFTAFFEDPAPASAPAPEPAPKPRNPKDIAGASKPDLSLLPWSALMHAALAMEDGAFKYGPGNFRETPVEARTYCAAAMRHVANWLDREENACDSDIHNLGHAIAGLCIVLEAQELGMLVDNRLAPGKASEVSEKLRAWKRAKAEKKT